MNVLIILTGDAGDIVFSTALIRVLKIQLENASLYYLTSQEGKTLLSENPYLTHVVSFQEEDLVAIRKIQFTVIVDLDNTVRSRLLSIRLSGKVHRLATKFWKNWLLTRFKINQLIPTNLADQYINAVQMPEVKPDGLRLDYAIPYKDEVPLEWLPANFQKNFVVFCISVPYATRRLPLTRMIELCDRINKPVILLGGSDDEDFGNALEAFFKRHDSSAHLEESLIELNKKTVVYNACGKFNINQQASLVKQSRYVFTFDNHFLSIASAFGKEVFAVYGNTVLDFGRYPYQTRFTILENNRLPCRPCSVKGYPACPLKHFKCMNEIIFDFYLP